MHLKVHLGFLMPLNSLVNVATFNFVVCLVVSILFFIKENFNVIHDVSVKIR